MFQKNKHRMQFFSTGFTIIELLVVIALISLLSSIIFASLNSAKKKSRDANRSLSIKQLQTALELYYDSLGKYPSSPDVNIPSNPVLTNALVPTYIRKIPADPLPGDSYRYYNNNQNPATYYAIFVPYETKSTCYVCGGSVSCAAGQGWWGVNICR